jgi:hypothetical protein
LMPGPRGCGLLALLPKCLPHLTDLRRGQLAGPCHPAVRAVGRPAAALRRPARRAPPDAERGLPARGVAGGVRRARQPPGLAGRTGLLPLRRDL